MPTSKMAQIGAYLLVALATFLVFSNSLFCDFTFDDNSAVVGNTYIRTNETSWWSVFLVDYWGTPIMSEQSHKSYRPLTLLSFRLNYVLDQLQPFGYHLLNVLLHVIVSLIVYKFMLNILSNRFAAVPLFATLFFALHPLKSEAVSGIVGRAEIMLTLFYLISLFCYFDSAYFSFLFYLVCAILSKEQGITIPGIAIFFEVIAYLNHRRAIGSKSSLVGGFLTSLYFLRAVLLVVATIALLAARFVVMGGTIPVFTKFDNPASMEETPTRQLTYNYLVAVNAKLLLYPLVLCADWAMNSIPLVKDFQDVRNVETVLVYLVLLMLIVRSIFNFQRAPERAQHSNDKISLLLALLLMIVSFLPASNLFFPVGFVIAERILYTPSIGYSLLLAVGFKNILGICKSKWLRFLIYLVAMISLASLGLRSYQRNFDWTNDRTLFMSGTKVVPNNSKLYNNIGHFHEREGELEEAIKYFRKASKVNPEDIGAEMNIARVLIQLNQTEEGEAMLWAIKPKIRASVIRKRMASQYLNLWLKLAQVISRNESRLGEAEKLYWEVITLRKDFIDAYINLGEVYVRKADFDEAIRVYNLALSMISFQFDHKRADIHFNLGVSKRLKLMHRPSRSEAENLKLFEEVMEHYQAATEVNSNHKEALLNWSIIIQRVQFNRPRYVVWRERLLQALRAYRKEEEKDMIEFNIAITLLDLGGPNARIEAVEHLKEAVRLKPDFRSALYNLALLYYDFKDYDRALLYLKQLEMHHANYTKALLLMADIYSRTRDYDLSEKVYHKVLANDNDNVEALHNLCVIYEQTNRDNTNEDNNSTRYCRQRKRRQAGKSQSGGKANAAAGGGGGGGGDNGPTTF